MAHLVLIPDSVASKLMTAVELARRLAEAGHRVTLIGAGDPPVTTHDLRYEKLDLRLRLPVDTPGPAEGVWRRVREGRRRRATVVAGGEVGKFQALLRDLAPDLLLIDIECHEYTIAAWRSGLRVGLINVFFNLWKRPRCPPLNSPLDPQAGRFAAAAAWHRLALSRRYRRLREWLRTGGLDRESLLLAYAKSLGFPLERVDRSQWLIPFVYRGLPVLTLNSEDLEFPHRPHPDSRYVGPLVRARRADPEARDLGGADAARLERLLADHTSPGSASRLIYASFGALRSVDGVAFWNKIAGAAEANRDWVVILGLGGVVRAADLAPRPPNVHAFDWAPQSRVLEHADCAVIHGGMTSVYECIHAAVPMVVCPFRVNDQPGTAARVVFHGLGVSVDREHDDSETIARRVQQVLSDGIFHDRVEKMRKMTSGCDRDRAAARAVEDLLAWRDRGTPQGWSDLRNVKTEPI